MSRAADWTCARESFLKLLDKIGTRKRSPTMIFATHRIEEIVPAFTHAIIIRDGKIVRAAPKKRVIRSDAMSKAFSLKVEIVERGGRYRSFTS